MKNKTINLIGRTAILGFVMTLILLPANAQAGVLMTDSFPHQEDSFGITAFIDAWFSFKTSEKVSPGVLMGD